MKKKDVPQYASEIFEGEKFIQYAVDEDGNYVQVKSDGLEVIETTLMQAWDEVNEEMKFALEDVKNDKKSPIYYFMKKEIMDIQILSETTGISSWKTKRHLKPNIFKKLKPEILEKYVKAFKLSDINELNNIKIKNE